MRPWRRGSAAPAARHPAPGRPHAPHHLLLAAASSLALAAGAEAKTLTISWWGFDGDTLNEIIVQPLQQQCGCGLVFETGNNADRLEKVKTRGGAGVDVIYLTDNFSQIGMRKRCSSRWTAARCRTSRASTKPRRRRRATTARPKRKVSAEINPPITSWADLWRADLKGQLSRPGSPPRQRADVRDAGRPEGGHGRVRARRGCP